MFFIWPIVFHAFGLYRPRRIGSRLGEIVDIAKACSVAALLLTGVTFFVRPFEFSRLVVLYFWVLSIAGLSLARGAFREVLRFVRRKGYNLRHAVLVGWGDVAEEMVHRLGAHPELGIRLRGCFLDPASRTGTGDCRARLPDAMPGFVGRSHRSVFGSSWSIRPVAGLVRVWMTSPVDVQVVPDFSV
jgi:FlaA1/EpsC-like NDP-sugar epimerase